MTLSVTSVSNLVDLLSPHEEEALAALIAFIERRTDQTKENLVKALSRILTVSYYVGADRAAKEIGTKVPLGVEGLDPVIERLGTHLDKTFKSLSGELTDSIKAGIKGGRDYETVKKALSEKITAGWGKSITFNNVGEVRKTVFVNPDGSMRWVKKEITRPITLPTDTYSETLARTSMKQAYIHGHFARIISAGYDGWEYRSVADERTRPRHLALHGRVFLFGTKEEAMAREVMSEYNCRCKPLPYPSGKTQEAYASERADWSRQTFDEWKLDKNMPLLVQEAPQSRKDLRALAPQLKDRIDTNDWHILAHQMGISHDNMVDDTISTIERNFFFRTLSTGEKENTAVHIYQRHVLNDTTRSGKQPCTMAEVIKAKEEGIIYKHLDAGGEKLKALWKSPDGRLLNVIMSNQYPGKVVTAYRIPQSGWDKIVKEGEEIAR